MNNISINLKKINKELDKSNPIKILEYCFEHEFLTKISYVCSFGSESAVILHMISKLKKDLPIFFLNTHFIFEETIEYKKKLIDLLNLENCTEVYPKDFDLNCYDQKNDLWKIDPDLCCKIRKILPLNKVLNDYNAWISGRKSYHKADRKNLEFFESIDNKIVVNPLKNFDFKDVSNYFTKFNLPEHPLRIKNYFSIGCTNCTTPITNLNQIRSGRWSDSKKTECGIFYKK